MKEFAIAFCGLSMDQQQTAMASGIKFPGTGNGQWVFTAGEAKAFSPRCDKLVPAIKAVSG